MNKTYTAIVVVIVIILAAWFISTNKKAEAPVVNESTVPTDTNSSQTPPSSTSGTLNATVETPAPTTTSTPVPAPVPAPKSTTSAVKSFTVSGQNYSFSPSTITVNKGDTVKITFKNLEGFHNFIIDELGVNSGMVSAGNSTTFQFVASKSGSFQYYCSVGSHRALGMWGTLTVK